MGTVYRVRDTELERDLAMKILRGGRHASTHRIARFLDEAHITGQMSHPGIVPVHEIGMDESRRLYFTMRLVEGLTLRAAIDAHRRGDPHWTRARLLAVIRRVCATVAYAHERGVVHRDLKPSNIMVGVRGETYVMDWGLALVGGRPARGDADAPIESLRRSSDASRNSSLVTVDGSVVGTPAYMAPEQARGELAAVGPRADVYALGAILYEILSGHSPYDSRSTPRAARAILSLVREGPPPPLERVPPELASICEKAMHRDTARRYADVGELAVDIAAFLEGRVVKAHVNGPVTELRKWFVRNRGVGLVLVFTFLSTAALTVAFAFRVSSQRQKEESNALVAADLATAAKAERDRADRLSQEAQRDRDAAAQLGDLHLLRDLLASADDLWPPSEENLPAMRTWIQHAEALAARRETHLAELRRLRSLGKELRHPYFDELRSLRDAHHIRTSRYPAITARDLRVTYERRIAAIEAAIVEIIGRFEIDQPYEFDTDELAWWHDAVWSILDLIERLERDDLCGATLASMRMRIAYAETLRTRTIDEPAQVWEDAIASIRDSTQCPRYGGLTIEPQIGLVPLGRDRESGLWEFWHIAAGIRPERDQAGRWTIGPETGVILVLLPGGEFQLGAQNKYERDPRYDPDAHDHDARSDGTLPTVHLEPFFLSKCEMTQAQWQRIRGTNPSFYYARGFPGIVPQSPVEQVSWHECRETMHRYALRLPTEAQWEYACRAGTDSAYPWGDDPRAAARFSNTADRSYQRNHATATGALMDIDDGHALTAPVGAYEPNSYGLHDMIGNVQEICLDCRGPYDDPFATTDGERISAAMDEYMLRGGSFAQAVTTFRSSFRNVIGDDDRTVLAGVRPARRLEGEWHR